MNENDFTEKIADFNKIILDKSNLNDKIIDLTINIFLAKAKCENYRKEFVISRSFPVSKIYDPTFVEDKAQKFINCFSEQILNLRSSQKCIQQIENLKECFTKYGVDINMNCLKPIIDLENCHL